MGEETDSVTMEVKGLDQILKALKGKQPEARVGILGGGPRNKGTTTNAEVGAAHEFGTSKLPQRSFLRVPIADNLEKGMEEAGLMEPEVVRQVIASGSVTPWLRKVATVAEGIVIEAFDTGGFGKWPGWKGNYVSRTGQVLVNTAQLRNSITSEVKE